LVNPETLARPVGYSHAVVAAPGRLVFLGGQTSQDAGGVVRGDTVVAQFALALDNLVEALGAAGGQPHDLVSLTIYVTDAEAYRGALSELGAAYRERLGRHFPATALFEVGGLFDPAAQVELVATAVVPE
jgi:enamine deaminase RidA (YjgF/YER057c/UK114 family)